MNARMISLTVMSVICLRGFADDNVTGKDVATDKQELSQARTDRDAAQLKVDSAKEKLKSDVKSGAPQSQIVSDKQTVKEDRKVRNEKQRKVNEERRELKKARRAHREEKHEDKK
jgi:hypothetical protein